MSVESKIAEYAKGKTATVEKSRQLEKIKGGFVNCLVNSHKLKLKPLIFFEYMLKGNLDYLDGQKLTLRKGGLDDIRDIVEILNDLEDKKALFFDLIDGSIDFKDEFYEVFDVEIY